MSDEIQNPAGAVEIDIDLLERLEKYNKELEGAGFLKLQREDLLRKYKEYDMELEGKDYEELSSIYKEVMKDTNDYRVAYKDDPNWIDKQDLRDFEGTNTLQEVQTALRELMRECDFGRVYEQNLKYDKELEDLDIDTYEQLADFYKNYIGVLYDDNFPDGASFERWYEQTDLKSYEHLDTYEELKVAFRDLMTTRDKWLEENERKEIEEQIEMPTDSDEQAGTAAGDAAEDQRPQGLPVDKSEASSATERVEPLLGFEAAPIEGEASSHLIGGGGRALPTEDLRDKAFAGGEGEGAPDAAAAPAEAGDADKIETPPDSVGHPIIGSFKDFPGIGDALYRKENYEEDIVKEETQNQNIDTQDVQGEAPVQKEAQEHQGINTQEQSTSEAAPEQSVSSMEAQWSVDQDELLNPYEDDPSSIPEDELLNPYEDDPSPIPKEQLLNPYEDDPVVDP